MLKKIIPTSIALSIFIVGVFLFVAQKQGQELNENTNTQIATKEIDTIQSAAGILFSHNVLGFTLLFPAGWVMEEHSTATTADFFDAVALSGPKDTELMQGMKIEVTTLENSPAVDLRSVVLAEKNRAQQEGATNIQEAMYVLDGRKAYVVSYKKVVPIQVAFIDAPNGPVRIVGYIGTRNAEMKPSAKFISIVRTFSTKQAETKSSSSRSRQQSLSLVVPKNWAVRNAADNVRDVQYEPDMYSIENSPKPLFWSSGKGPDDESTVSLEGIAIRVKQMNYSAPTPNAFLMGVFPPDSYITKDIILGDGVPATQGSSVDGIKTYNQEYVIIQDGRAFIIGVRQEGAKDSIVVNSILESIMVQ